MEERKPLPHARDCFRGPLPPIQIADVGALWLGEEPYDVLVQSGMARIIGFEPLAAECEALNRKFGPHHSYLPYAVADGSRRPFYRCAYPMTSSLYEPNQEIIQHYHNLPDFCVVQEVLDLQTVRLDDVPEVAGTDYLKLDVQGAELDVLKGAKKLLETVLAIHTEVEFVPIYRGQPLFADVDQFLREHGFTFHRFANLEGRVLNIFPVSHDTEDERRQILWADAVYIKDRLAWQNMPAESLLRLAVILHYLYGSFDFAAELLRIYDERTTSDWLGAYLKALGS